MQTAHHVHARPGVCTSGPGVHELGRYGAPVTQLVRFRLDDDAAAAVEALRARAATAGCSVPPERPALTAAAAVAIPPAARTALADELRVLALPTVWLATLGSTAGRADELVLAAVVDTELLAVHTAVHDALAGRVRGPVAAYLPGAWLPHCVLASPGRLPRSRPCIRWSRSGHRSWASRSPMPVRARSSRSTDALTHRTRGGHTGHDLGVDPSTCVRRPGLGGFTCGALA